MSFQSNLFKSIFSFLTISPEPDQWKQSVESAEVEAAKMQPDPEQVFLQTTSDLSVEEHQKHIQRREWYARLAERQGIVEAEQTADRYWRSGQQRH